MRVVHITTTDDADGAGIAARRLHNALRKKGIESHMIVKYKKTNDPFISEVNKFFFIDEFLNTLLYFFSFRYWFSINSFYVKNHHLVKNADIVHIHNIQYTNFFSPLFFPKNKQIVWTFHDMWPLTGNCNYTFDQCDRFIKGCFRCKLNESKRSIILKLLFNKLGNKSILKNINERIYNKLQPKNAFSNSYFVPTRLFIDNTKIVWSLKKWIYDKLQMAIIVPSNWLFSLVRQSEIVNVKNVINIPNPINIDVFNRNKNKRGKKIKILFVGQAENTNKRKGFRFFLEALNYLDNKKYSLNIAGQIGYREKNTLNTLGFNYFEYGTKNSEEGMAKIYQESDITVVPSIQDNLPNTILESMACGTPVVAFDSGGIGDLVNEDTGYLVRPHDVKDLAIGIRKIHQNVEKYSRNARKFVEKYFSEQNIANKVYDFYASLLYFK